MSGRHRQSEHIRGREALHGRTPVRRKGDPRAFATEAAAKEGGKSLFELFMEGEPGEGDLPKPLPAGPMFFEPAKVRATILLDLEKVNDMLSYDPDQDISVMNEPKLYVTENCQNLIRAIFNWSPDQGSTSPWKDPIDTLRYLFDQPLHYADPAVAEISGGQGW